jgi:hypothetical protein
MGVRVPSHDFPHNSPTTTKATTTLAVMLAIIILEAIIKDHCFPKDKHTTQVYTEDYQVV